MNICLLPLDDIQFHSLLCSTGLPEQFLPETLVFIGVIVLGACLRLGVAREFVFVVTLLSLNLYLTCPTYPIRLDAIDHLQGAIRGHHVLFVAEFSTFLLRDLVQRIQAALGAGSGTGWREHQCDLELDVELRMDREGTSL